MRADRLRQLALLLLADEGDGVADRGDERFEVRLGLAALQAQRVDVALHLVHPCLGSFHHQLGAPFGLAHDAPRFLRRVLADVVSGLLRRHQRALQAALEVAILRQRRLETGHLLAQAVVLAQGLLVAVRSLEQEGGHFSAVEPAQAGAELRLPHVERRHGQIAIGRGKPTKVGRLHLIVTLQHLGSRRSRYRPVPGWRLPQSPPRSRRSSPSTAPGAGRRARRRTAIRREDRARYETIGARLRAYPVRAAASSTRRPGRRDMRPRPRRAAAPRQAAHHVWSLRRPDPPGSAVPARCLLPLPRDPAARAARPYRPIESWRTPAPLFGPCSSAGGQSNAT